MEQIHDEILVNPASAMLTCTLFSSMMEVPKAWDLLRDPLHLLFLFSLFCLH